jgi:hypothetical protein
MGTVTAGVIDKDFEILVCGLLNDLKNPTGEFRQLHLRALKAQNRNNPTGEFRQLPLPLLAQNPNNPTGEFHQLPRGLPAQSRNNPTGEFLQLTPADSKGQLGRIKTYVSKRWAWHKKPCHQETALEALA